MEKYCISLPQAKRLVELGFKRESQWGWANDAPLGKDEWYVTNYDPAFLYPAYHVGELGEILPDSVVDKEVVYFLTMVKYDGAGFGSSYLSVYGAYLVNAEEDTEAQLRGALLIYLLENGLI